MSLDDFQLKGKEPFDNSIIRRNFFKKYHQQRAISIDSDQNVEFISGGNNIYHQIGKSYLEFVIRVRNPAANFDNDSSMRLTNNGLAYVFKEARLSTTSNCDLEHNIFVGKISTFMRYLTSKVGDLLSQFEII